MIAIFFLNLPMNDHHFGWNKKKHFTKTLVPSVETAHQFVLSNHSECKRGRCESRSPFYTQEKVSQTRVCKTRELGLGFGAQTRTKGICRLLCCFCRDSLCDPSLSASGDTELRSTAVVRKPLKGAHWAGR